MNGSESKKAMEGRESALTERRRRARALLSELFLDRAITDDDVARLGRCLRVLSLGLDEIEQIYADELAPVLQGNLNSPCGEWSGFDTDWLETVVTKQATDGDGTLTRWMKGIRRYWYTRHTYRDWLRLKRKLQENAAVPFKSRY